MVIQEITSGSRQQKYNDKEYKRYWVKYDNQRTQKMGAAHTLNIKCGTNKTSTATTQASE